ncbi:hypothetical protein [Leptospira sp. GIMC2001]|uniref:hypothetical protein n=1 Tax=Leptospira sp. GIMC2001 TaxID=1513297 RepID=UPI00234AEE4B|nr:hypothetical protein [Leptospira sp. GIMC2001]WCL49331.1 hypothetical protein O4O04_18885 [Leptospira sp. GIMC2001]
MISRTSFFIIILSASLLLSFNLDISAQENESIKNSPDSRDRFVCIKIATTVDGQEYDKTLKCETNDAICYVMEGFSFSCIPKIKNSIEQNK